MCSHLVPADRAWPLFRASEGGQGTGFRRRLIGVDGGWRLGASAEVVMNLPSERDKWSGSILYSIPQRCAQAVRASLTSSALIHALTIPSHMALPVRPILWAGWQCQFRVPPRLVPLSTDPPPQADWLPSSGALQRRVAALHPRKERPIALSYLTADPLPVPLAHRYNGKFAFYGRADHRRRRQRSRRHRWRAPGACKAARGRRGGRAVPSAVASIFRLGGAFALIWARVRPVC